MKRIYPYKIVPQVDDADSIHARVRVMGFRYDIRIRKNFDLHLTRACIHIIYIFTPPPPPSTANMRTYKYVHIIIYTYVHVNARAAMRRRPIGRIFRFRVHTCYNI